MSSQVETILHPTDFSAHSQLALELACSLAREQTARLVLLHVAVPPVVIYKEQGELLPRPKITEVRPRISFSSCKYLMPTFAPNIESRKEKRPQR